MSCLEEQEKGIISTGGNIRERSRGRTRANKNTNYMKTNQSQSEVKKSDVSNHNKVGGYVNTNSRGHKEKKIMLLFQEAP